MSSSLAMPQPHVGPPSGGVTPFPLPSSPRTPVTPRDALSVRPAQRACSPLPSGPSAGPTRPPVVHFSLCMPLAPKCPPLMTPPGPSSHVFSSRYGANSPAQYTVVAAAATPPTPARHVFLRGDARFGAQDRSIINPLSSPTPRAHVRPSPPPATRPAPSGRHRRRQRRPRSLPPSSRTPHDPHTTRRPPPTIHAPITTRHSHVLAICESLALMGAALSIDQSFYDAHPRHSWICNTMYSAEQHCRNNALASFESVAAEVATCLLRATDALRARLRTDTAFPISAPIRTLILSGPDQTSHDALQCNNLPASRPRTTRLLAEWVDCMASANAPAPAVSWLTSLSPAWADESSSEATHSSTASSRSTSCSTRSLNPRDSRAGPAGASVLSRARNPLPISSTCGTSQSGSESDCGVL